MITTCKNDRVCFLHETRKSISENHATDWISFSVIDQTRLADSEDRHCGLEEQQHKSRRGDLPPLEQFAY